MTLLFQEKEKKGKETRGERKKPPTISTQRDKEKRKKHERERGLDKKISHLFQHEEKKEKINKRKRNKGGGQKNLICPS